ncbi:MAG: hypothetical protein QHJ73_08805, partial [Armatimonadota bacterium]|nr:hypothetical protein [Armatimonadota bacterium]
MNQAEEALPADVEAVLLAHTPPAALLAALKAAGAEVKVLAGFRTTAASLKLAPVRERLRHELETNSGLRGVLLEVWRQTHTDLLGALGGVEEAEVPALLPELAARWGTATVRVALWLDGRAGVRGLNVVPHADVPESRPTAPPKAASRREDPRVSRLREQAKTLRHALASARKEAGALRSQRDSAQRLAEKLKSDVEAARLEATERRRVAERAVRQLERLQKQKAEMEARLREAVRTQARERRRLESLYRDAVAKAREERARADSLPNGAEWLRAVREVMDGGEAQAAVRLLSALARKHPEAVPLRETLVEAHLAAGAPNAAAAELCALARACLEQNQIEQAVAWLVRAFALAPEERAA